MLLDAEGFMLRMEMLLGFVCILFVMYLLWTGCLADPPLKVTLSPKERIRRTLAAQGQKSQITDSLEQPLLKSISSGETLKVSDQKHRHKANI